jgi:succinate dehydrogenase / fumarate reductase membrane anchor subunit
MNTNPSLPGSTGKIETIAWVAMRISGIALVLLLFGHVLIQDVLVGVQRIDIDYVAGRWASPFWRIYDFLLLALAFTHGMYGLRRVLNDYIHPPRSRRLLNGLLLGFWLVVTLIGGIAIIGGVRSVP